MSWRPLLVNRVTITFGLIAGVILLWNLYVLAHDDGILEGRVVGPDGSPVADAEVVLSERTIVSLEPIAATRTDPGGRFRFEDHDRHHVVLSASKDRVGTSGRIDIRLYFRNQNLRLEDPVQLAHQRDVKGDKRPSLAYAEGMTDPNPLDLAATQARLAARRRELEELTAGHQQDARPTELDQARVGRLSRMDALQAQEMAAATERRRQVELERIDSALERIASGDFGFCVRCGEDIGLKRLEFDPTTPLCITCAQQSER